MSGGTNSDSFEEKMQKEWNEWRDTAVDYGVSQVQYKRRRGNGWNETDSAMTPIINRTGDGGEYVEHGENY